MAARPVGTRSPVGLTRQWLPGLLPPPSQPASGSFLGSLSGLLTTFLLPLTFPEVASSFTEFFANCTYRKGFTFSKCFIIFNELILFSPGWLVSWLGLLGKKLKARCHGVPCCRSPPANPGWWAHGKLSRAGIALVTALVVSLL